MWHAEAVVGVLRKSVSGILPKMDCGGGGGRHGHGLPMWATAGSTVVVASATVSSAPDDDCGNCVAEL